jgi:uncharacterized Ntn-hydrolase superfamily protein
MASDTVWPAMLEAYEQAQGQLRVRLLDALDAAEAAGGDLRGRQSAALLIVSPDAERWRQAVSLRVEDHPEPLAELRRLVRLHDAYELAGEADQRVGEADYAAAAELYRAASALAPDNHELLFWAGLGTAQSGELDAGARQVARAIELHPPWAELLTRLPPEVAPSAARVREQLAL